MTEWTRLEAGNGLQRIGAFCVDWFVIATWGGILFGGVWLTAGGIPQRPDSAASGQLLGFLSMTLPVILYFTLMEGSRFQASLGKKVLGLVVTSASGGRASYTTLVKRNLVKFLPWEIGHYVAQQAIYLGEAAPSATFWIACGLAAAGPAVWMYGLFLNPPVLYDRIAGSRVVRSRSG